MLLCAVRSSSSGTPIKQTKWLFLFFSVNIVDVNDEAPVFEPIYGCVTITEFHDLHDVVTTVKASDADDPNTPNGRVLFSIVGGNDLGMCI